MWEKKIQGFRNQLPVIRVWAAIEPVSAKRRQTWMEISRTTSSGNENGPEYRIPPRYIEQGTLIPRYWKPVIKCWALKAFSPTFLYAFFFCISSNTEDRFGNIVCMGLLLWTAKQIRVEKISWQLWTSVSISLTTETFLLRNFLQMNIALSNYFNPLAEPTITIVQILIFVSIASF